MDEIEALELNIKVWQYLADHPHIFNKNDLPPRLWDKIKNIKNQCPLCEYYYSTNCGDCVLHYNGKNCTSFRREFRRWYLVYDDRHPERIRKQAALDIVKRCQERLDEQLQER